MSVVILFLELTIRILSKKTVHNKLLTAYLTMQNMIKPSILELIMKIFELLYRSL